MLKLLLMDDNPIDLNLATFLVLKEHTPLDNRKLEALMDARPFWDYSELSMLPGFGKKTLERLAEVAIIVPPHPLDVNLCSLDELQSIPGVGIVIARRIVAGRPYDNLESISVIQGISSNLMYMFRQRCVVSEHHSNSGSSSGQSNIFPLDINDCDLDELLQLPGIGPKLAQRIISSRPFAKIEDLICVNGVGTNLFEKLIGFCEVTAVFADRSKTEVIDDDTWFTEGIYQDSGIDSNLSLPEISNPVMSLVAYEAALDQEIRRRFPLLISGWITAILVIVSLVLLDMLGIISVTILK